MGKLKSRPTGDSLNNIEGQAIAVFMMRFRLNDPHRRFSRGTGSMQKGRAPNLFSSRQ
jgi:hypothetical protein